ncbi:putative extracellular serine carboxypeptidase [Hyphodiscus hymeniophilus]|uniref:Extracellular serine carboxypeptidase n=1 Tax=Hyphodiscus hymeniophilus TaxID=353542 RepID=A0A9P7B0U3_9HELO|nr:putative extracellular serine carboxypeptidase [Hyphodiscus hymeniophilus]
MRLQTAFAALISTTAASFPARLAQRHSDVGLVERQAYPYPAFTINQIIDHFPESPRYEPHPKGTFKQRYFFDDTYYKPGGPVYLYLSGETSGTSRFSSLQTGIIQILMEATNGLGVILENRYYGQSFPYNDSSTDHLAFLTTEQTIADNAYFAQHAVFPGVGGNLTAPGTPWILYGGSLAGAQTAFSVKTYGDILYGGIGSSATTKAVLAYPVWYDPIQKFAPQDCVASINAIIEKMDTLVATKNQAAIQELKAIFGLEALSDIRDFAMTIAFTLGGPMNYPTSTWQELNWYPAYSANDFWNFCGNVSNIDAPSSVTEVDWILANYTAGEPWVNLGNYANYFKINFLPLCPEGVSLDSTECFGTQNTCTEAGLYQVAKSEPPRLISEVLQVDYTQQWCNWAFPKGKYNAIPSTPDLERVNVYGGYSVEADRLAHIDGGVDVWLDVCFHSHFAPARVSTDLRPEYLIAGGGHHWDSYGILDVAAEPNYIREAHLWEIRTVKKWLRDFGSWKR